MINFLLFFRDCQRHVSAQTAGPFVTIISSGIWTGEPSVQLNFVMRSPFRATFFSGGKLDGRDLHTICVCLPLSNLLGSMRPTGFWTDI